VAVLRQQEKRAGNGESRSLLWKVIDWEEHVSTLGGDETLSIVHIMAHR